MISSNEISGIRIKSIKLNDGSSVSLAKDSIVVLTGPNNCGKSQCLRDIVYNYFSDTKKSIVIDSIESDFVGSLKNLKEDFSHARSGFLGDQVIAFDRFFDQDADESAQAFSILKSLHQENRYIYNEVIKYFFTFLNTASRLVAFSDDVNSRMSLHGADKYFMEKLALKDVFEDCELESKLQAIISAKFGKGISLNRYTFEKACFHYVSAKDIQSRDDVGRPAFSRWFENLPKLDEQGDGLISFCNILISILTNKRPLLLLDEPEAFLHAPQIRGLANLIASETNSDTQIIISTHSHDLVQGLIDFGGSRIIVARMTRRRVDDLETNALTQLTSANICELWQDPLLRTSDVLTSLFHHVAVIVEGDSDARFLRAMLDTVEPTFERSINIRFLHCNGKDRIPKIARALKAIGVPVLSVVDIDIIDDRAKFLNHITSFGGDTMQFQKPLDLLIRFVNENRTIATAAETKDLIDQLFTDLDPRRPLPTETGVRLLETVRNSTSWSLVKRSGETFFTRGEPYNAFRQILKDTESIGILINNHGELENLCRSVEARKSEWLNAVLQRDLAQDPELLEAREFVRRLFDKCLEVAGSDTAELVPANKASA